MLITLIATDEDVQAFSSEVRNILSSLSAGQPVQTASIHEAGQGFTQPHATVAEPTIVPQPQPSNHAGQGADISWAREAKALYNRFRKASGGREPTKAEKDAMKAGQSPEALAGQGQVQLPATFTQPAPVAQPTDEIAQLKAQLDAAVARLAQPAQPQTAAAIGQVQRYGQLPQSGDQLPMNVRQVLANWAAGLTGSPTEGRMHAVAQYAAGGPLQPVVDAYGAHLDKVLKKVNSALSA